MLNRREFLKLSALLAAGAVVSLSAAGRVLAWDSHTRTTRPLYRLHGHGRSGCAFRPELVDLWSGGGADLPDTI